MLKYLRVNKVWWWGTEVMKLRIIRWLIVCKEFEGYSISNFCEGGGKCVSGNRNEKLKEGFHC